jgi:crotonobetainyl-CoA:carnitine CoA-transferase CaiB-like acyl-CoA transferase
LVSGSKKSKKTIVEWEIESGDMDIVWGKVPNMDEMFRDLQFRDQEMAADVPD